MSLSLSESPIVVLYLDPHLYPSARDIIGFDIVGLLVAWDGCTPSSVSSMTSQRHPFSP